MSMVVVGPHFVGQDWIRPLSTATTVPDIVQFGDDAWPFFGSPCTRESSPAGRPAWTGPPSTWRSIWGCRAAVGVREDGLLDARYPLVETPWAGYPQRTEWNVRDSDGTLVLTLGPPDRGTALTIRPTSRGRKPCLVLDLAAAPDVEDVYRWAGEHEVRVLNVAGPRENSAPGVYGRAVAFLHRLLE